MLDEALYLLKSHNYKITKQRRSLLGCLYSNCRTHYINVIEIDTYMRKLYPGMSHSTIYRNIREFNEIGIIEMQNKASGACVKYQCDFSNLHHHHFICRNCGKVQEVQMCPMDVFESQLPGCKIEGHRFELYGLCKECAQQENDASLVNI
ncbi:transcriptional repressor [Ligilactobacillus sp. WILCCON 0076]|uniref:Transcriptional repressor n=1 Tax=Ligilactobacillus ubinensis TaxID=2876789 RepID=A0A9X2FKF1_9LACO|nr:transcriptional repressor [Ligilactobacillus ubinensis]MCP0887246.1 transcriptional repressor [Ligilactobacillus ubinensis]